MRYYLFYFDIWTKLIHFIVLQGICRLKFPSPYYQLFLILSYLSLFAPCHTKLHHKLLAVSFSARFKYSTAARSLLR